MSSLVLIPWPETAWSAASRIEGRSPVPLTEAGKAKALAWGRSLADAKVGVVFSGPEQAAVETARVLAGPCRAKTKAMEGFFEVDVGLWDGLTEEDLKRRSPKAFKTWRDDPASICPPEGEDLTTARERLRDGLARLARKHALETIPVVLGPLAFAVTRCVVESRDLAEVRSMASTEPIQYALTKDNRELTKLTEAAPQVGAALMGTPNAEAEQGSQRDG
jgi:broad specificity phosphatase PhoE